MWSHCLLSTPSPRVPTTPFPFTLFACLWDGVTWMDSGGSAAFISLVNSDNRYRTNWEEERRWREWQKRRGRSDIQRCCVCLLPASCYSCLPLCRKNRPFPLTAPVPLCITKRNLSCQSMPLSAGLKILDSKCITGLAIVTPSWKSAQSGQIQVPFILCRLLNVSWWKQSGKKKICSFPHYAALSS